MNIRLAITGAVLGIFLLGAHRITAATPAGPCPEEQAFCATVVGVCDSEETKKLCPLTCDACLPSICQDCQQNCTLYDDGKEYACTCNKGYKLDEDGVSCSDINECAESPHICGQEDVCQNHVGSFECKADKCKVYHHKNYVRSYSYPAECCKMSKGKCGQNNQNRNSRALRISHGESASAGMWPWHAMIIMKDQLCGAALISDNWIVTAAQCFRSIRNGRRVNGIEVLFGVVDRNRLDSHTSQERQIIQVFKHSKFKFPLHDIAVAKLDRPIKESEFVRPVCLPNGEMPKVGTRCFATGFGVTGPGVFNPSEELQHVDLPITDITACREAYKGSPNKVNTRSMMCAGGDKIGKDTCLGDSGGPLVCQRCDSCDWYLAGITSFGSKCGSSNSRPGVYTEVAYYENWIALRTKEVKAKKGSCRPVQWSPWGDWTNCDTSCGGGTKTRIRVCSDRSAVGLPGCLGNWFDSQSCNTQPCGVGPWSEWSDCSETCGGGQQTRARKCDAIRCRQITTDSRVCNEQTCPQWGRWSRWTACSRSCGGGTRSRSRSCENEINGVCGGPRSVTENCNEDPCSKWDNWSRWTECNEVCGGGIQISKRECDGGVSAVDCKGKAERSRKCNTQPCTFTDWSDWTECSTSCGPGMQERQRSCRKGTCRPDDFGSLRRETKSCNLVECTGRWSEWDSWSQCTKSCGGGVQTRSRSCERGLRCSEGVGNQERECSMNACIGEWSSWSQWSPCDATCDSGRAVRSRNCDDGIDCPGKSQQSKECMLKPCSKWSPWTQWSECDRSCGDANKKRQRYCEHGDECRGEKEQTKECLYKECPTWSMWTEWSPCLVTCGGGLTKRERTCLNGPGCVGDKEGFEICNEKSCETWSVWTEWSQCDATCGNGNRVRTRSCQNGESCAGVPKQTEACQITRCPTWSDWSDWSACSKTCGKGERSRNRTCNVFLNEDAKCVGDNQETQECSTEICPSQCDELCVERVKVGACRIYRDWISRICHPDCCGPAHCRDESPRCQEAAAAGYCGDPSVLQSCLVSCGLC